MELALAPFNPGTIHLAYSPVISKSDSLFNSASDGLTVKDLKEALKKRKIVDLNIDPYHNTPFSISPLTFISVVTGMTVVIFNLIGTIMFTDPVNQHVKLCQKNMSVIDTVDNKTLQLPFKYPCYLPFGDLDFSNFKTADQLGIRYSALPIIFSVVVVTALVMTCIGKRRWDEKKKDDKETFKDQFNQDIKKIKKQFTFINQLEAMAPAKNVALSFELLSKEEMAPLDELKVMNFKQLQKAKAKWGQLFDQHLKACHFSKLQLCIFRLLDWLKNPQRQLSILQKPLSQQVIGSDPHVFEAVVKLIKPLTKEKTAILCDILKNRVLKKEISSIFKNKDLKIVVETVAKGKKLSHLILSENNKPQFLPDKREIKTEEQQFQYFLKTNKLTLKDPLEAYHYLKMAKNAGDDEMAKWLEKYLSENLDAILETKDKQAFFNEIKELRLDTLHINIDQRLAKKWKKNPYPFDSDQFQEDYTLAIKQDLTILASRLKSYYHSSLEKIQLPTDAEKLCHKIHKLLEQIKSMFSEDISTMTLILTEKVSDHLIAYPQEIENIANAATKNQNEWLIKLIKQVYQQNEELLSNFWLNPFEDEDETLII